MQSTKLDYQAWAIAIYMVTTNIKGVSSIKLHRHLAHRLRETSESGSSVFVDLVEIVPGWKRKKQASIQEIESRSRWSWKDSGCRDQGQENQLDCCKGCSKYKETDLAELHQGKCGSRGRKIYR